MNWEDEGYLLSKKKFRENANIINVFTLKKGKVGGIVYGGNSRKIRNYLQISNKLFVFNNTKNDNQIGYFKTELIKPIAANYFSDKTRMSSLTSMCSLLNSLLPESQQYLSIYQSVEKFLDYLSYDEWIVFYIYFEISLIKELGFDTNLQAFYRPEDNISDFKKISIDKCNYEVPNFLIKQEVPNKITKLIIKKSLSFTRNILLNKFFIPSNLKIPRSRIIFESYFN